MKLSVIIPCYNAAETMSALLETLTNQRWTEWEIIVSDNGSHDASLRLVHEFQKRLPQLRSVDSSERKGCGAAKNVGVQASTGEACIFCDADDEVAPGWLQAMGEALTTHDLVMCRYDHAKLNPAWTLKIRGTTQVDGLQRLKMLPFSHGGGGTIGIRRTLHDSLGGFDTSCMYSEDIDYCLRAQLMGIEPYFVKDAVIYYRNKTRLKDIYEQARNWARDESLLQKRYCPATSSEMWRWRAYFAIWLTVMKRLPELLRTQEGRGILMWRLGRQIGTLQGSVKYGIPPNVEI